MAELREAGGGGEGAGSPGGGKGLDEQGQRRLGSGSRLDNGKVVAVVVWLKRDLRPHGKGEGESPSTQAGS